MHLRSLPNLPEAGINGYNEIESLIGGEVVIGLQPRMGNTA